jgi:hypothetical protein
MLSQPKISLADGDSDIIDFFNPDEKRLYYRCVMEQDEKACSSIKTTLYDTVFFSNSFILNSSTVIDSLFYVMVMEIGKLPAHGWMGYEIYELLKSNIKNCRQVTVPKSLFSLFNKTEQDSLYSMIVRNEILNILNIADLLVYDSYNVWSPTIPISILACSIRTSIEQEPNGEYTLLLNNTPYKMIKISDNHYVVRAIKEKTEKEKGNRK